MELKEEIIQNAGLIANVLEHDKCDVIIKTTKDNDIKIMCFKPVNVKPRENYNN